MSTTKKVEIWLDSQKWEKLIKISKFHKFASLEDLIKNTMDDVIHDEEVLLPEFLNEEFELA
jgi:hypothetical protein